MFTVYDAYINALTESVEDNKFDNMESITLEELEPYDIPLLYDCKYELPIEGMVKCNECGNIFPEEFIETQEVSWESYEDYWDYTRETPEQRAKTYTDDVIVCPLCGYGSNQPDEDFEYSDIDTGDLFSGKLKGVEDYMSRETYEAFVKFLDSLKKDNVTESVKLEEDDADFTNLKTKTKSELLKYLKKNGLDIDNLVKTGVQLDNLQEAIDMLLSDYTSPVIAEYEQQFNVGLAWDYEILNNDIVISITKM